MKASDMAREFVQTMQILTASGINRPDAQEIAYKLIELSQNTHDGNANAINFAVGGDDEINNEDYYEAIKWMNEYEKSVWEKLPEYYTLESVIERAHLWRASSERSKHFVNDIEAHKNSEYVNHREQYRKLTKRQDVDECKLKTAEV